MLRTLYHGSNTILPQPKFGYGKPYNDYGLGFYCTESLEMAKEWGVGKGQDGYANCYRLDCTGLRLLDLSGGDCSLLLWLTILLENRTFDAPSPLAAEARAYLIKNFHLDYGGYDLIQGYRADDSYFSFAQDFLNGTISLRQLGNAMHLGKLGLQLVLKSELAFQRLTFLGSEPAPWEEWYAKKMARDRSARRNYFDSERNRRQRGDLYIPQILDEEMSPHDPRLR